IQSRLARGRTRLRERLIRRGVAPAIAALTVAEVPRAADAAVSIAWKRATLSAVAWYGRLPTTDTVVSVTAARLAKGALKSMNIHKLVTRAVALVVLRIPMGPAAAGILARWTPLDLKLQPAAAAGENAYRAKLKNGASIEVLAVSTVPTGPGT